MLDWIFPLFRPSFWFAVQPPSLLSGTICILFALALLPFLGWGLIRVHDQKTTDKLLRRVWRNVQTCLISFGSTGFLLLFLAWQRIPFLSLRVFWLIWFAAHAGWLYALYTKAMREIPAIQKARAERASYEKWLPKAKKRSA